MSQVLTVQRGWWEADPTSCVLCLLSPPPHLKGGTDTWGRGAVNLKLLYDPPMPVCVVSIRLSGRIPSYLSVWACESPTPTVLSSSESQTSSSQAPLPSALATGSETSAASEEAPGQRSKHLLWPLPPAELARPLKSQPGGPCHPAILLCSLTVPSQAGSRRALSWVLAGCDSRHRPSLCTAASAAP